MQSGNMRFDLGRVADHLMERAESFVALLPLLLIAIVVVWLSWWIGRWLSRRALLARVSRRNPFLQDLVRTAVRWAATVVGLMVALEILGATRLVGAVLGTAGVLGVALGFAFKDILENYLAGLLMSLRQPFAPRDWVVIDGNEGLVVAMTSRATILMTLDGNHVRLPNATVFASVTLNYTRNPRRRLEVKVGIGVDEDIAHAQQVGMDALRNVPGVIAEPAPRALVQELGDWSVVLAYQGWVDQRSHDYLLVASEATRMVKEALDDAGVEMPYPVQQVLRPPRPPADAGTHRQPAAAGGPQARPASPVLDTRRSLEVLEQVDDERDQQCGTDLLHADAPRE